MFVAFLAAMTVLTPNGLGDIRTGMTEADVEAATGRNIELSGPNGSACTTASLGGRSYLLFAKGRLRRVTVASKKYATKKGVSVGDPQETIGEVYGAKAKRSPHTYEPKGFYFDIIGPRRGLRFETDGKRITQIHGGRKPELTYVEGCS